MSDIEKDIGAMIDEKPDGTPETKLGERPVGKPGEGQKLKPFPHEYGPAWQKFLDERKKRTT